MELRGRCHCGNIDLVLHWTGDPHGIPARACGCTFCTAHGAVWTCHPQARLEVTIREPAHVSEYAFGTETAQFRVCTRCGVVPLSTSTIDGVVYAVVNVRTLQGVDPGDLRHASADFDGEALEDRLARRSRNWIADVRVATAS